MKHKLREVVGLRRYLAASSLGLVAACVATWPAVASDEFGTTFGQCLDIQTLKYLDQQQTPAAEARNKALVACRTKWRAAPPVGRVIPADGYECHVISVADIEENYEASIEYAAAILEGGSSACASTQPKKNAFYAFCRNLTEKQQRLPLLDGSSVTFLAGDSRVDAPASGSTGLVSSCIGPKPGFTPVNAVVRSLVANANAGKWVRKDAE